MDSLLKTAMEYINKAQMAEKKGNYNEAKYYYAQAAKWLKESTKFVTEDIGKIRMEKALECERHIKRLDELERSGENHNAINEGNETRKPYVIIKNNTTFKDVVGLDEVKEKIKIALVYQRKYPELYKRYKIKSGGRILLYGPPGCGKTHLAKSCAGEIRKPLIYTDASYIMSKWVGESEKNVAALFNAVRGMKEAILFIDEIDSIGASRKLVSNSTVARRVVTQLLTEIDNIPEGVLLISATNHPWDIDAAMLRSGRFGTPIFIPPPDFKAREILFRKCLESIPSEDIDYNYLAKNTDMYSAADIAADNGICEQAKKLVFEESVKRGGEIIPITMKHFEIVFERKLVKPTILFWVIESAERMKRNEWIADAFPEMVKYVEKFLSTHGGEHLDGAL